MDIRKWSTIAITMVATFTIVWLAAFTQSFDEMENPETGEIIYQEKGNGPDKPCFNPQGKPIPCPHVTQVPLDNFLGIALLFAGALAGFFYLKREREKDLNEELPG